MLKNITVLMCCVMTASCTFPRHLNMPNQAPKTTREIAACVRNPNCHQFFPTAHRGLGFGAPENSRETMQKAVAYGVPMIELDVRLSKDNKIFVLHDATLDRTTSWLGKISDLTSDELEFVTLANGEAIPTFADIYQITKNKSIVLLDIKGGIVEEMVDWIVHNGSFDDVIFCVNNTDEFEKAARMKKKYPAMIISAEVYSEKDLALLRSYFPQLPEFLDIGHPIFYKFSWMPKDAKINASFLVYEIGLPFLKPFLPYAPQLNSIDIMMTNDPKLWMEKY